MRLLSPALQNHLVSRQGRNAHALFWFQAKNRTTQAIEEIGLWTGDDDMQFVIDGVSRSYRGGAVVSLPALRTRVGLGDRTYSVTLSQLSQDVRTLIQAHDLRKAPVEVHIADFALGSYGLIDEPERIFKGRVRTAPHSLPAKGGDAAVTVNLSAAMVRLLRPLALKKSDESLRLRAAGDGFRKYMDATGTVVCLWGETRSAGPS